jgi:MFS family permease
MAGSASKVTERAARWGLFVLTLINLFNYVDRSVYAALVESLKHSELRLSDSELGWLGAAFVIVYTAASPFFGTWGDRGARPRLIAIGIAIWSFATSLGGLARSFATLFAARATVGIGEAAYGTVAPALLADYFPLDRRGRAFAVFNAAIPIGSAAGLVIGGLVDQRFGWRAAFLVAGLPGLLLAWLALRLFDPPRGALDLPASGPEAAGGAADSRRLAGRRPGMRGVAAAYGELLANRPYLLGVLGYAAVTFALGGLQIWMPAYLERVRGMPRAQATVQFGAIVVAAGFAGTFAGGWLGDLWLRRSRQAYLWLSGLTALAAAPLAFVVFTARSRGVYMTAIAVAAVLVFMSAGPINSAIMNAVQAGTRATAGALQILLVHLLGDVPSPPLIGAISDRSSLGRALLLVPLALAAGGGIWMWAAWSAEQRGARSTPAAPAAPAAPGILPGDGGDS